MKPYKAINNLMLAVLFVMLYAACSAHFGGFSYTNSLVVIGVAVLAIALIPQKEEKGVLRAGIYLEAWAREVMKFTTAGLKATFLEGIADYSKYVSSMGNETQAIHIASMNVLPEVLIDNTTYPIGIADLPIQDMIIALNKFQTVASPITDDEKYASTVDKMGLVKDRHARAIMIKFLKRSIYNLAPIGETAKMPMIVTTGPADPTGRKRMVFEDILSLKGKCDDLEIDDEMRRLVLCSDHVNDLIFQDKDFRALFYNRTSGKLLDMLSFNMDSYTGNPYYNPLTKAKIGFGAVPATTDQKASVFFSLDRAAKAIGWTKAYIDEPTTQDQRTLINFRHNAICMPTAEEMRGGIISANS